MKIIMHETKPRLQPHLTRLVVDRVVDRAMRGLSKLLFNYLKLFEYELSFLLKIKGVAFTLYVRVSSLYATKTL